MNRRQFFTRAIAGLAALSVPGLVCEPVVASASVDINAELGRIQKLLLRMMDGLGVPMPRDTREALQFCEDTFRQTAEARDLLDEGMEKLCGELGVPVEMYNANACTLSVRAMRQCGKSEAQAVQLQKIIEDALKPYVGQEDTPELREAMARQLQSGEIRQMMGVNWVVTVKQDLVPDDTMYHFTDPFKALARQA